MRVDRLAAVQVEAVLPFPPERLARHFLEAGEIDLPSPEDLLHIRAEVLADVGDDAHLSEERRGDREVGGGAADHAIGLAKRGFDRVECNRANGKYWVHQRYFPMIGARSFLTCAGTASGRVMRANLSAVPHSHERATGSLVIASAIARWAVSAFFTSV